MLRIIAIVTKIKSNIPHHHHVHHVHHVLITTMFTMLLITTMFIITTMLSKIMLSLPLPPM